jgi:hypothetical protein
MSPAPSSNLRLSIMQFLAGTDGVARSLADDITRAGQWPQAIELCARWKLVSALETRLRALAVPLRSNERDDLGHLATQAFMKSSRSLRSAGLALAALERAGVRCAGFKGIAAIAYLYPGARSRTLQDVDVLIDPNNLSATLQLLESLGYRKSFPGDLQEYLAFLRNTPGAAGNEAMSLSDADGAAIDLHWHLGAMNVADLLSGLERATVLGQELPLLSPAHSLLLCVHHALRNDFVPDDIARDVLDFSRWHEYLDAHEGWPPRHATIDRWGLGRAYLALDTISSRLTAVPSPASPVASTVADRRSAARIADLYYHQLQAGPLNTDLTYIASHRPWLQIASGFASGWQNYRSHMRQSESLNGEDSLTLSARLGKFLRSVGHVSPVRWLQLRALAQAKDRVATPRLPRA